MTLVRIIKSWSGMDLLRQTPGGNGIWEEIQFNDNKVVVRGHRLRMKFLASINGKIDLDLYGYGFHDIDDKWDGLVDYRYSLAIENNSNQYYWSEKLADCFLAWTMPIYYGCRNINEYFPEESLVQIDIAQPDSFEKVEEAICSDAWKRNRDAVAYARDLILNHYQLFPFLTGEIKRHQELDNEIDHIWQSIFIPSQPRGPLNSREKARKFWRKIAPRKLRKYLFNHLPTLERFR